MKKIYIAGHTGMVGSAILRRLRSPANPEPKLTILTRTRAELNLLDQPAVRAFMQTERPDLVVLAAARVGGIYANNTYPADFIYDNLMIECNVIHQAFLAGVKRLLFLGSSCIYPRDANQPMKEAELLSGRLELTNEPYAVAKIAGIKLCESYNRQHGMDYRSVMPTNLYGPGDNFHPKNSHVVPAMLRRFHEAARKGDKEVTVWGTGRPRREFLYVDDMADACIHLMELTAEDLKDQIEPTQSHINVGTGTDCSIAELAEVIADVVGFEGRIRYDATKPDGTPRKLLDVGKLRTLGWESGTDLNVGLARTYDWFLHNQRALRL